jgi:hypothetical protein
MDRERRWGGEIFVSDVELHHIKRFRIVDGFL